MNGTFLLDVHGLEVCWEASKEKDQQLKTMKTQLDTAQHEYQDKEQQCLKLELELYDMKKRIAVVTDELVEQCMIAFKALNLDICFKHINVHV